MENRTIKIVAIDDNPDNLITLKALIKDAFSEAKVFTALTGQQGIGLAAAEDPDVILLDIIMPGMDGFEVCTRLKADIKLRDTPVVFVTALKGDRESRIKALQSGAEAFLTKPIDESELTAQIRAMVKIRDANIHKRDEKESLARLLEEKSRELVKSEAKFRQIAENVIDVVWTADMDMRTTYISPSVEKMLGESPEAHMRKTAEEKLTPNSLKTLQEVLLEELEKEKDCKSDTNRSRIIEVEHYRADGSVIWVSMHVSFWRDENGKAIGFQGVSRDITEQKLIEEKIIEQNMLLEKLPEQVPGVIYQYRYHPDGRNYFPYASSAIYNVYEVTPEEVKEDASKVLSRLHPDDYKGVMEGILESSKTLENWKDEYRVILPKRGERWVSGIAKPEKLKDGSVLWHGYISDITERKKNENDLLYLSNHDHLTGLYNRRFFEQELKNLDTTENLPLSIIMCDVNGLKLVNDSFGHDSGDAFLKKTAETIKKPCREKDIIARIGGDEFVILLPKTSVHESIEIANQIKELASKEKVANIELSISYGYDTKITNKQSMVEIIANAENYMYRHKLYERSSMRSKTTDLIMNTLFEKSNREAAHSKRVSNICESIASKMNMDKAAVNQMKIAGLIHDIGKIGIDEKILNKQGSLSPDERRDIERHPEIGWRLLSSTNEFSELAQFILNHHEKWDGSGYPNGLKGEAIQLEARIIAIADAYDAMTSERTYNNTLSKEEAIKELNRCSGTQFDPEIVDVFVNQVLQYNKFQGR